MNPRALALYRHCVLCPRACGVNRLKGERGFCGEGAALRLAAACLHRGEEPPLAQGQGSGAVFVSGCNLRCVFCQNHQISRGRPAGGAALEGAAAAALEGAAAAALEAAGGAAAMGRAVSEEEFAGICLLLQRRGAANINIVTGAHAAPAISAGIAAAREHALTVPVLWNSSGYESAAAVDALLETVDVFLPDLKTLNADTARRYFGAADYPAAAAAAIQKAVAAKPLVYAGGGDTRALLQGVIVRHLALPGRLGDTRRVLEWFAANARGRALLSLMTQYTPIPPPAARDTQDAAAARTVVARPASEPERGPRRFLSENEYQTLLSWLAEFDLEDGYYQEWETGSDWLPDFERAQPFPGGLADCVWHWKGGL